MDKNTDTFSALVLAAGFSGRMGHNKALLPFDHSQTFLERIIHEYRSAGCERIVCVVNKEILPFCQTISGELPAEFLLNEYPERGRIYSVQLGLQTLLESSFCFIQNVDNPLINKSTILRIFEERDHEHWCRPEYQGKGGHPVLLPKKVTGQLLPLTGMHHSLKEVLHRFPYRSVLMENDAVLTNINTPDEFRQFQRRVAR